MNNQTEVKIKIPLDVAENDCETYSVGQKLKPF
jgi:hypothetical protein